jgi:predicted transcriptional regulator
LISYKEAGLEEEFKISSVKLQQQRNEYKQFSKAAELKQKDYRHQVEGFTQSLARQASNAIK